MPRRSGKLILLQELAGTRWLAPWTTASLLGHTPCSLRHFPSSLACGITPTLVGTLINRDNATVPPLEAAILSNLFIAMIIVGFDASRHNWFRHKDGPVPEKDVPSQNIVLMGKKTFLVLQVLLSVISLKFYSFLSTIG